MSEHTSSADTPKLDASMKEALRSLTPPPGQLEALQQAMEQAVEQDGVASSGKESGSIPFPTQNGGTTATTVSKFTRRGWLSAAAVAAVSAGGLWFRGRLLRFDNQLDPTNADGFLADAARKAAGSINLRKQATEWDVLVASQKDVAAPVPALALSKLQNYLPKGCQDYEWRGEKVGLFCISVPDGLVHLFSVATKLFAAEPPAGLSALQTLEGRQCCTWVESGVFTAVVGASPQVDLSKIRGSLS